MIYIDNRGSGEAELAELLKKKQLAVEIRHLDSGDIMFGKVGIERKTTNDLINSISGQNRHFWEQLKVLKATYKQPFVLLEGPINFNDAWLSGTFFSIISGWRIPVIPTYNLQDSATAIKRFYLKYGKARCTSYPPSAVRKADTPEKIRWMMLQCVRGIGPVAAKRILEKVNPFILTKSFTLGKVKGLNKRSKELLIQVFKG